MPEFNAKHFIAKCSAVQWFMSANALVYCMGMHKTQCMPDEIVMKVQDYMYHMHPLLEGPHCDGILNMDQMPVYFSMPQKRTLDVIKTVHIQKSTNNTKFATVAVMIASDGTVLLSMVVFKGKPDG